MRPPYSNVLYEGRLKAGLAAILGVWERINSWSVSTVAFPNEMPYLDERGSDCVGYDAKLCSLT